mmetsp:Transcript_5110/g.8793  ORF Transcript_5110/g.8793 Transcript_5110/m.8793 type:complete len:97 (+) Transcript_5110:326-616(+)
MRLLSPASCSLRRMLVDDRLEQVSNRNCHPTYCLFVVSDLHLRLFVCSLHSSQLNMQQGLATFNNAPLDVWPLFLHPMQVLNKMVSVQMIMHCTAT